MKGTHGAYFTCAILRAANDPFYQAHAQSLVASVERSLAFDVDTLGFEREIFFNEAAGAVKEYPGFAGKPLGATGTLLIEVEGVDALHDRLVPSVTIVMAIETEFYGMREFPLRIRMAM